MRVASFRRLPRPALIQINAIGLAAGWIWDARLRTADKLEKEAALLETRLIQSKEPLSPPKAWVQLASGNATGGRDGIHGGS